MNWDRLPACLSLPFPCAIHFDGYGNEERNTYINIAWIDVAEALITKEKTMEFSAKWSKTFTEFSEFRESEKSLRLELGLVWGSALLSVALWLCGSVAFCLLHRKSWVPTLQSSFLILIFFVTEGKAFRENSNAVIEPDLWYRANRLFRLWIAITGPDRTQGQSISKTTVKCYHSNSLNH